MISCVNLPGNYQHLPTGAKPLSSAVVHNLDGIRITHAATLEEEMATYSSTVLLPGEFYGQRSLEGYSPWSHKELNTIE